ncbi:MAG: hypothetical protein IPK07_11835 [Deltaproteobacteria bacterium]|nr:hypothetical protein [Deltaproteobacteria bacterium]
MQPTDPSPPSQPERASGAPHGSGAAPPRDAELPEHGLDPLAGAAAIRDQVGVLRDDAARLVDLGRAARTGLEWTLRERLERSPYSVLAAAAGVGAILGGALTPAMILALASGSIRLTAATALRGALMQALGSGLGQANGREPAHANPHDSTPERTP